MSYDLILFICKKINPDSDLPDFYNPNLIFD